MSDKVSMLYRNDAQAVLEAMCQYEVASPLEDCRTCPLAVTQITCCARLNHSEVLQSLRKLNIAWATIVISPVELW